jgi:SAM-dependent methyltransferase
LRQNVSFMPSDYSALPSDQTNAEALITPDQVRELALALPEAVEQGHHGRPSFRVAGRIFATLWDPDHVNVMLDEGGIHTAVESWPGTCRELWWGKRLAAAQVDLSAADEGVVRELLTDAWERRAPVRLMRTRAQQPTESWTGVSPRLQALAEMFHLGEDDLTAWQDSGQPDAAFDGWLTDRVARRPTGRRARATYGADDVHDFARRAILSVLELNGADRLLEIGCGGGLLLRDALSARASATGIDHSEEMVSLARERAPGADVVLGGAEVLPFADATFTAVAMPVVFFFFTDPEAVLRECHRVLCPGGRLAVYTTSPALRGTPAAPEPLASQGHLHESHELVALAETAGFRDVTVEERDGGQLLTGSA